MSSLSQTRRTLTERRHDRVVAEPDRTAELLKAMLAASATAEVRDNVAIAALAAASDAPSAAQNPVNLRRLGNWLLISFLAAKLVADFTWPDEVAAVETAARVSGATL